MKKIDESRMANAINEYVSNPCITLRDLSSKYGYSYETFRKRIGNRVRPRGGKSGLAKVVSASSLGHRRLTKLPSEQLYNNNNGWTPKDDELLREALKSGYTSKELSEINGRSIASIQTRKCTLINEGFIPKGTRFIAPRGFLRKAIKTNRVVDPIKETNRLIQKYSVINKSTTMYTPVSKEKAIVQKKSARSIELENSADINAIKLDALAAIVNKHGISVSISVLRTGTEIRITK